MIVLFLFHLLVAQEDMSCSGASYLRSSALYETQYAYVLGNDISFLC